MSFLSDELKSKVETMLPCMGDRIAQLELETTDDESSEVIIPCISTTHELSLMMKDVLNKGFVFTFDTMSFKADMPANDVLKNPLVAAMHVADGFNVVATKGEEVMIFGRLQQRKETDVWGFEVSKQTKQ